MKIRNSLKSLKSRHRDCRVIRRRGRTYVINKTNRRFKAAGRAKPFQVTDSVSHLRQLGADLVRPDFHRPFTWRIVER